MLSPYAPWLTVSRFIPAEDDDYIHAGDPSAEAWDVNECCALEYSPVRATFIVEAGRVSEVSL